MSEEQIIEGGEVVVPSEAEKEARQFGWVPKDEYRGPEEKWRSAEEFLEEGKRINGFLRRDMEILRGEISKRDTSLAELQQTMREFAQFHQETERRAYERALGELKAERKEALKGGDGEKVVEIEEQMERLNEARAPLPSPAAQKPGPDPVWQAWVGENKWFTDNPKLRAITNGYGDIVRAEQPTLVGRPFLEEVKRRVQGDFPEMFENPARRSAPAVGGSGESRGSSGKKGYADLPAEAKQACDKFVAQKLVPSREAYVRDYFGE